MENATFSDATGHARTFTSATSHAKMSDRETRANTDFDRPSWAFLGEGLQNRWNAVVDLVKANHLKELRMR